jgi:CubicO group peptidase (beta-lactamase class C family)
MNKLIPSLILFAVPFLTQAKDSLSPVRARMQAFVNDKVISGSVTAIATKDKMLSQETVGYADLKTKEAMRSDHLFWIASMTKPMAAVCVLQLQEEGKLSIEDPVEKHLPEFKGQWMVDERDGGKLILRRAARTITIRDLLTHTSGLANTGTPRTESTLGELVMSYSKTPLNFEPGSKWSYSNAGINTLGRIVEVVSKIPFADFLQERVLDPCDMKDTTFWPSKDQAKRIAKSYRPDQQGELQQVEVRFLAGGISNRKRTPYPAGGLYSTAGDVTRFYQMMLNGGTFNGKRVLKKETAALMTQTQTGDIKTGFVDGMSWGLGFQVVKVPMGVTESLSAGTYGHGGAYATQSWADPKRGIIVVMMIQRAGFRNGDNSPVRKGFQEAAKKQLGR